MSDNSGLDLIRDILIEGIEWRSKAIARSVNCLQYDKITSAELNEVINKLDEALLSVHSLYGR